MRKNHAFSLVELSIVLVILGLLVGGVLAGKSLIRASELNSLTKDVQRYSTAAYTFRDKYFYLPGDMPNATAVWGTAAACPVPDGSTTLTSLTCNGNGDGTLSSPEGFRAWQHLSNAALIEGQYSGGDHPAGSLQPYLPYNAPALKIDAAASIVLHYTTPRAAGDPSYFEGSYGNMWRVGKATGFDDGFLFAQEAWNIDTKIDDGVPGKGKVRTLNNSIRPNCVTSDDRETAVYKYSSTSNAGNSCNLFFLLP